MSRPEGVPGPAAAAALLAVLVVGFWLAGAYGPTEVPSYASSPQQIVGMALMLTLLPPYLMVGVWLGQRRSLDLIEQTRPRLDDPAEADAARETIRGALRRTWPYAVVAGVVMGLLNTQPLDVLDSHVPVLQGTISMGQILLWLVVGLLFGIRAGAARAFRRLAEIVPIDLLRPDRSRLIARSGLVDVVLIMGALLFAPLQSIDAEFRWYNYRFGLLVALPSAAFFLVWPLVPLRRRNVRERDTRLAEVERQLGELGTTVPSDADATVRLEALLDHRDRLRSASTWPLGMGILSRVVLYMVIPPLAWAGAALVERFVNRLLGG